VLIEVESNPWNSSLKWSFI